MARKKQKSPPFVMLRKDLLKDPEWRKLSSSAKIVYIYLRSKFSQRTIDNGEVTLAYSEVSDMLNHGTIARAFKELIRHHWVQRINLGGLWGKECSYRFIGEYSPYFYKGFKR